MSRLFRLREARAARAAVAPRRGDAAAAQADLHYFDEEFRHEAVKILPGEFLVTARDLVLVTVLGSCVAACIRDPGMGLGGINHFMLPDDHAQVTTGESARYGMHAMELLINELLKRGARRGALEAKVFGGGSVLPSITSVDVGRMNADFVRDYLSREGVPIAAADLGGTHPRKVFYFPKTGRVMVKRLPSAHDESVLAQEERYHTRLGQGDASGDVELFDRAGGAPP